MSQYVYDFLQSHLLVYATYLDGPYFLKSNGEMNPDLGLTNIMPTTNSQNEKTFLYSPVKRIYYTFYYSQ